METRLGDVIDDYCIKCRRLTNHSVVSLMESEVAKVRCRSCYHEHSYLREIAPPSRKDLKKAEMLAAAAREGSAPEGSEPVADEVHASEAAEVVHAELPVEAITDEVIPDEVVAETAGATAKPSRSRSRKA